MKKQSLPKLLVLASFTVALVLFAFQKPEASGNLAKNSTRLESATSVRIPTQQPGYWIRWNRQFNWNQPGHQSALLPQAFGC